MSNRTIITAEVDAQYQSELLFRANYQLVHEQFAKELAIESRGGSRVARFRRYVNVNPATTPLTEGVTPSGSTPTVVNITKTLAQYGDFIPFNDVVTTESVDPVISELTSISGDQM
jgi:N4-gp56 family major capsid protein